MIYITTYLVIGLLISLFTEIMIQKIIKETDEKDIPPLNTKLRLRLIIGWPIILFMSVRDWLLQKPL